MGKLKGILKITGEYDGLLFYELNGQIVVRKKTGFEGKGIKTKANYVRTRENASEFGRVSVIGKRLRMELYPFLKKIHTPYLHNYVLKQFLEIMRCDILSERGKRTVTMGLQTEEGRKLLQGFEFNKNVPLSSVVVSKFEVLAEEGQLVFPDLKKGDIRFPEYGSHIALELVVLWFDAETEMFSLVKGERVVLPKPGFEPEVSLAVDMNQGSGLSIVLLFAEFLQEVNEELLGLEGCSLTVVGTD
ncbi:hypothetical protein NAT51_13005 [Flavobacterium amniphilum]|uniref:hypothetical protein n=1 Tax=Flavobacterium amniphilum TaxID=1834035 RepID=UPI00202A9A02|nr:hypothetical protein [Flavobacterium amniphilum]MCL9806449.1 hypothetical protein [Flavobacterium amniphilum]